MHNLIKPVSLLLLSLATAVAIAEPVGDSNWREQVAVGMGAGTEYGVMGFRLDLPLTRNADLLLAAGRGAALGFQYRPFESLSRVGFGAMYGATALATTYDEEGYEDDEAYFGGSVFLGIAPRYDRFSFSAGVSYVFAAKPAGISSDDFERQQGDAHWQASLGLHLPLRIRLFDKFHSH